MDSIELVHGTCLEVDGRGVLIIGASGAGKSDLALRLIDQPGFGLNARLKSARLVADDQVALRRSGDDVLAAAPAVIAGQIELRGLGPVPAPVTASVPVVLIVKLRRNADIDRLPEREHLSSNVLGIDIATLAVDPQQASAPARIRAALDVIEDGNFPPCQ